MNTDRANDSAANLSLCMVNVAYCLQTNGRQCTPNYSILDLKADCRGYKYVEETIKMLPENLSRFYEARFSTRSPA